MTDDGRRYFSGNTVEQAIMQAARHYGLEPEEIAYKKVDKRHGFLKARRGVVIEVDPEAPARTERLEALPAPAADAAGPEGEAPHLDESAEEPAEAEGRLSVEKNDEAEDERMKPEATGDMADAARSALQEIFELARLDLDATVLEGDGQLEVELWGADRERLLADRGDVLLAIQHLLPRLIRGHIGRSVPCRVDSENFHQLRRVELERLAVEAAQEVRQRHRPRTLPPMSPAERRIIHITLADEGDVVTESQGRGYFKRVTVRLAMRRPRGFDRYSR